LSFSELLSNKLIQIAHDLCINFDLDAISFFKAFQMSIFTTLNALVMLHFLTIWFFIVFEASVFMMTNVVTFNAKNYVLFSAVSGLMAYFVAFKAHFFVAVERFMGVFSTENAIFLFCFVWATF
jgi:hypothetical protein